MVAFPAQPLQEGRIDMLSVETISIEEFIANELLTPQAKTIMVDWPLPPERVQSHVIDYFRSLGIYTVNPIAQKNVLKDHLLRYLVTSKDLADMIENARRASLKEEQRKGEL